MQPNALVWLDRLARPNKEKYREALTPTGMRMGLAGRPCAKSKSYTGGSRDGVSQKPGPLVLEWLSYESMRVKTNLR